MLNQYKASLLHPPIPVKANRWTRFLIRFYRYRTINEKNPFTLAYFRSQEQVLEETKRHYKYFRYMVHPLSQFRMHYDIFKLCLYLTVLFTYPLDFGFESYELLYYTTIFSFLDFICLFDVGFQFFLGYCDEKNRSVILQPKKIAMRYLLTYFIFDLLSSTPECLYRHLRGTWPYLVMDSWALLKFVRLKSMLKLIYSVPEYFGIKSRIKLMLMVLLVSNAFVGHLFACLHAAIPKHNHILFKKDFAESWVVKSGIINGTISPFKLYMIAAFKSSIYSSCIETRIEWLRYTTYSETVLVIINYMVGKCMYLIAVVVLACLIFLSKSLKIKFQEILTELNVYMTQKQVPPDLKKRLTEYYIFKYQRVFFNEHLIQTVLSRNLKKEIKAFLCKSLISKSSLLGHLSPRTVNEVISYVVPEIFLYGDTIIHAGDSGDAMYFVASGTVAIYTQSGREVCHLQEGSYFGEIALVLKNQKRTATVVAVETTKVYKLNRKHFEHYFLRRENICQILLQVAEEKIAKLKEVEATHQKLIFKKTYASVSHEDEDQKQT